MHRRRARAEPPDREIGPEPETGAGHPGTSGLDIGLEIALLDDEQYVEIGKRLRQEGFGPDHNEQDNPTPQRWKLGDLKVTIDFLLPPIPGAERGGSIQPLEGDLAALMAPGLQLASSPTPMATSMICARPAPRLACFSRPSSNVAKGQRTEPGSLEESGGVCRRQSETAYRSNREDLDSPIGNHGRLSSTSRHESAPVILPIAASHWATARRSVAQTEPNRNFFVVSGRGPKTRPRAGQTANGEGGNRAHDTTIFRASERSG